MAEDTRSLAATSLAYKIISASITDIWAFYIERIKIKMQIIQQFKTRTILNGFV